MKRFLIINPFGIGDVLFTTPVINAIKAADSANYIGLWCNERVAELFLDSPHIDDIFALSRGDIKKNFGKSKLKTISAFIRLIRSIQKEHFDVALDFSLDYRYALIAKLIGIKKRIGFDYKNRGLFLTDKIKFFGYEKKHVVEYYQELLQYVQIEPKDKNLELFISDQTKSRVDDLLAECDIHDNDRIIGIAPGAGASWGNMAALKHWPATKFAQLADKIAKVSNAKIILLGDGPEKEIAQMILRYSNAKLIDLTGRTTIRELAAVIQRLSILICNDGGPLHMAVALNIRTVSIFGPVDEYVYGPYLASERHIVISQDIKCRPCYYRFRMPECKQDRICINSIDVGQVFDAVRRQL